MKAFQISGIHFCKYGLTFVFFRKPFGYVKSIGEYKLLGDISIGECIF